MKRLLKENKILFVLLVLIIICVVAIAIGLFSYFYDNDSNKYGDRLRNIEKYAISDTIDETILSSFESGVNEVMVDVKGKIIYILIDVVDGSSLVNVQSYAIKALESFNEEEKSFYDIQFIFTCDDETLEEEEDTIFPIEGYKSSTSNQISWTMN